MKNLVSIVEIPVSDFARARAFYEKILDTRVEEVDMGGVLMGVFPAEENGVNVALVRSGEAKPSMDGTLVYLNAGDDLKPTLSTIEKNGGAIVVPKTEINPDMGFFAVFTDTEGNKLGLYSVR